MTRPNAYETSNILTPSEVLTQRCKPIIPQVRETYNSRFHTLPRRATSSLWATWSGLSYWKNIAACKWTFVKLQM